MIRELSGQVSDLMDRAVEVVVVSSGAIGAGLGLLERVRKGASLSELQAIASVGQTHLMDIYNGYFNKRGYIAGQILLTQDDFSDRRRFLNIRYTINTLIRYKAIPVINENDSVSTEEIKCGDNDRISSLVSDLAGSELLVILTDVEGLFDDSGHLIEKVKNITGEMRSFCKGKGCGESTGGMATKLEAVRNATQAGIECVIASGRKKGVLTDIVCGAEIGTRFIPRERTLKARKRWIAFSLKSRGSIIVDSGAERALVNSNKSLLPSGVIGVSGKFSEGDVVDVSTEDERLVARGLSNYSSDEIEKIKGKRTYRIEAELGYKDYDEVIHRDNLVIVRED